MFFLRSHFRIQGLFFSFERQSLLGQGPISVKAHPVFSRAKNCEVLSLPLEGDIDPFILLGEEKHVRTKCATQEHKSPKSKVKHSS